MIISRGRKYVFVHIPKTGGTALTLALEQRAMRDDILVGDTQKARARRGRIKADPATAHLRKHSPLSDLGGVLTPVEMDSFFIFTLVRNPWDRLVSYYHWLRAQGFDHPAVALAKTVDFSAFLNDPATQAAQSAWPAHAYMTDSTGRARASGYVRIEHLQNDLAPFEAHLGFTLQPLPYHNASARARDWRVYYTDADARLIGRLCADDIAAFDYQFDL